MPVCRFCSDRYKPARPMQPGRVCNKDECQAKFADAYIKKQRQKQAKAERIAAAQDRKTIRLRKEQLKTRSDYMKEAQVAFNAYIRERDKNQPCICCGQPLHSGSVGGAFDCGHYRSVGSAPHLRFDERNAHAQRKQCNRYGAGRAVDYRIGLIHRIGEAAVVALESDNAPRHWTKEQLIEIRDNYRARLKTSKKEDQVGKS